MTVKICFKDSLSVIIQKFKKGFFFVSYIFRMLFISILPIFVRNEAIDLHVLVSKRKCLLIFFLYFHAAISDFNCYISQKTLLMLSKLDNG